MFATGPRHSPVVALQRLVDPDVVANLSRQISQTSPGAIASSPSIFSPISLQTQVELCITLGRLNS